jgi:predicted aspartyl protease
MDRRKFFGLLAGGVAAVVAAPLLKHLSEVPTGGIVPRDHLIDFGHHPETILPKEVVERLLRGSNFRLRSTALQHRQSMAARG